MMSDTEMRIADTSIMEESVVTSIVDGKLNTSWASSVRKSSADFTASSSSVINNIDIARRASIDMGDKRVNTYIVNSIKIDSLSNSAPTNLVTCQVTPIPNEHDSMIYSSPQVYTCQLNSNNICPPISNSNFTNHPISNITAQSIANTMCQPITSTCIPSNNTFPSLNSSQHINISNITAQPINNDYNNLYTSNNNIRQSNNNIYTHVNNGTCQHLSNIESPTRHNINDYNSNNGYQVEVMLPIKATITFTTEVPLNAINPNASGNATIPLTGQVPISANVPLRASLPMDAIYNTADFPVTTLPSDNTKNFTQRRRSITEGVLFNNINSFAHLRTQSMFNPSPLEQYDTRNFHSSSMK